MELNVGLTNDDNGAIYHSYDLYLFHSLGDALYALPHNATNYASADDLRAHFYLNIRPIPDGEVVAGWYSQINAYNPVQIINVGGIFNVTYAGWYATQQNPAQDTMRLLLQVPKSQLDANGDGTNDLHDYSIELADAPTEGMGVGYWGANPFPAPGRQYLVSPNGYEILPSATGSGTINPSKAFMIGRQGSTTVTAQAAAGHWVSYYVRDGSTTAVGAVHAEIVLTAVTNRILLHVVFGRARPRVSGVGVESPLGWLELEGLAPGIGYAVESGPTPGGPWAPGASWGATSTAARIAVALTNAAGYWRVRRDE